MTGPRAFFRDQEAAGAAEFALILPVMLLFLFGIIDFGRYAWDLNQIGKAVQVGARRAVVTNTIPEGLQTYSYAVSGGVPQGTPVTSFPGIVCSGTSSTTTCTWKSGSAPNGFSLTPASGTTPFQDLVNRMREVDPDLDYANVRVDYDFSGLGFAGDPNGPDLVPLTKVTVTGLRFYPIVTWFIRTNYLTFPDISYSLSMEDGSGSVSS